MLKFVPLLVFLVLAGFLARGLMLDPATIPSALQDKPAPDFSLPLLGDENSTVTASDLKGSAYVLNVFASWCVSCVAEHPLLVELARQNSQMRLVGLNYKDEPEAALQWLARFGNPFEIVLDDRAGLVGIDWGVIAVPETFVVDAEGVVRFKHTGPLDQTIIDEKLRPLLEQLAAPS